MAYEQGIIARQEGCKLTDNPHTPNTTPNDRWDTGWKDENKKKKYTKMFTKKQLRAFVRPMYSSSISFGHTTPEEVEKHLDTIFGKRSR